MSGRLTLSSQCRVQPPTVPRPESSPGTGGGDLDALVDVGPESGLGLDAGPTGAADECCLAVGQGDSAGGDPAVPVLVRAEAAVRASVPGDLFRGHLNLHGRDDYGEAFRPGRSCQCQLLGNFLADLPLTHKLTHRALTGGFKAVQDEQNRPLTC